MKRSIEWHEECLKNEESHLQMLIEKRDRELALIETDIGRARDSVATLKAQISRARRLGKNGFDAERFSPGTEPGERQR